MKNRELKLILRIYVIFTVTVICLVLLTAGVMLAGNNTRAVSLGERAAVVEWDMFFSPRKG